MLQKTINKLPKSVVEVTITVSWADLEPRWNETLQRLGADLEMPGFRKGAAPTNLLEQNLGNRVADELLKTAQPAFLIEALKGTDIIPIDYPKYQLISFGKGQGLQYKATITNRPAVIVGNYKAIKVARPALKPVSEEEVQKVVDDLFKRWQARGGTAPTGGPASADSASVATSAKEAATAGKQGGSISFQGGNQPQTNGQTAGPDDNFAKAMGATTLVDLKAKIRKDLEDHSSYNNELDFEEAILQEVEKITQVELPDILIEDELNRMLVSLQRRVADMGLLLEDYLKGQGKSMDQLKREWRPQAEKNVRMELGLAEIARMENVQVTDAELQAEIDKIQDSKVKQQFEAQEPRLHLRHALRQTRTLNLLKNLVASS